MKKFGPVLNTQAVKNRVIENAKRDGKDKFMPTSMAIAFVESAVRP